MKAAEVLRRYAAGERNFRGANLRGQSFKRENLAGADFQDADIRSTNFTKATLTGANFRGAKAGLQRRWQILLTVVAFLLSALSGFFCWFPAFFVTSIFESDPASIVAGWVGLGFMAIFWIIVIRKGINAGAVAIAFALLGAHISWRALVIKETEFLF